MSVQKIFYHGYYWVVGAALLTALATVASGAESLTLDQYLNQVRDKHTGIQGALEIRQGAELRSQDSHLAIRPTLIGNVQLSQDDKNNLLQSLDKFTSNIYTLGISQLTTFGLQAKLTYNLNYYSYTTLPSLGGTSSSYYDGRPVLELSQALWRNGFGSETRAQIQASEASAMATSFSQSYQGRVILSQAESAYWNLALARSAVRITLNELDRAQALYEWTQRRARLQLAESSDLIQAEALLKLRKLDLQAARDSERTASQNFNQFRGTSEPQVAEEIVQLDSTHILPVQPPKRAEMREDVKAAREQTRAAEAQAQLGKERVTPQLDVYASLGLGGQETTLGSTLGDAFNTSQRGVTGGVRLSIPLDPGLISDSRKGYALESSGADKLYQRRLFDQENDWSELNRRYEEAQNRLKLNQSLAQAQREKLRVERDRLNRGRTTTFNVIQFEQDFLQAELAAIRAQADVLLILAQMKTFGGPL